MTMDMESAGSMVAAGLVAREIDGINGGKVPLGKDGLAKDAHGHGEHCLNCNAELTGEFCHACGQRAHLHKSLLHLGEEVLHGILHFDAKGWRTLPMLVLHPGQLTRRYIDGHRTRYVSPLALFLFMVFLMFFVASLTTGKTNLNLGGSPLALAQARTELAKETSQIKKSVSRLEIALAKAKMKGDAAEAQAQRELQEARAEQAGLATALNVLNTTGEVAAVGKKFDPDKAKVMIGWQPAEDAVRHAMANPEFTIYKLKSSGSKLSFLLVPISLPFLWLMFFWRRGVTMYDHAVFSLYSLSFMSLMFVAVFILYYVGASVVLPYLICLAPPVHMFAQLRGTYGLGKRQALWRTVALLCISSTVFTLYLVLILIMSMR